MEKVVGLINGYFHEPYASLVNGIVLGRDLFVTELFLKQLKNVGLIHIVVLSGQNITLLSQSVLRVLTPFLGRQISLFIAIFIVCIFVWFVGLDAPAFRAGIMGVLALLSQIVGRRSIPLYLLFLTGVLMLIYDVKYIESISFQLSFAATFGIIIFSQSDSKLESTRLRRFLSFLLVEFRTALSAQAFTVPIIFWYFREISLIAPISNILISFTIAPIMLLGGMTIVVGLIDSNLGYIFSFLLQLPLQYMVFIVETLSKMPFIVLKL